MSFQLVRPSGLPCFYRHDALAMPHGFFTAEGGVSSGLYDSLNCGFGSDDDPALVHDNRSRAAHSLTIDPDQLVAVYQVHGAACESVTQPSPVARDALVRADGLVTRTRGLGLTILTADCLPVLLADRTAGVIGACHAGWRGACAGITSATINAMQALGARDITALIGPTIQQASYQVGGDMRDAVIAASGAASGAALSAASIEACFAPDEGGEGNDGRKYRFDLPAYVRARLVADGIGSLHDCGIDTYVHDGSGVRDGSGAGNTGAGNTGRGESPAFFSHRRATHAAAADSGRQISMIAL